MKPIERRIFEIFLLSSQSNGYYKSDPVNLDLVFVVLAMWVKAIFAQNIMTTFAIDGTTL